MVHNHVCYLEVSSWVGIGIGAEHYYGELHFQNNMIRLEYRLTQRQATRQNKKMGEPGLFRKGDLYTGFDSPDDLSEFAKSVYKECFPEALVLVQGRHAVSGPHLVIDAPGEIEFQANKVYEKARVIGFWDDRKNDDLMDEITAEWDEIVRSVVKGVV